MPFGLWIQVVPRKHIGLVNGVQTPYKRAIFRGKHMPGHIRRQSAVSCASTAQQRLRWATVPQQSGPKSGGGSCCALFRGGGRGGSRWGRSNTMSPGPRPTSVPTTKWYPDASSGLATIDSGRKLGFCCVPFWRGELGPI